MRITRHIVQDILPARRDDSHKGDYGHVLVLAGSRGMSGAAVLCAHAALRCGAGLVTLAAPEGAAASVARKLMNEIMLLPVGETPAGSAGLCSLKTILSYIEERRVNALALGPGLSRDRRTQALVLALVRSVRVPLVIDADALNALPGAGALKGCRAGCIITPHPGEFSRLSGRSMASIAKDRSAAAGEFARESGAVCVLKGRGTVVTDGKRTYVNTTGNPGMSTAGAGDVLTGMIAALIRQVRESRARGPVLQRNARLLEAAAAGAYLHGLAGDIAAKEKTEICMAAGDIIEALPRAVKRTLRSA